MIREHLARNRLFQLLALLTVFTAGEARLGKKDGAGNDITGTESDAIGLDEWDNSSAPRPVFYSRNFGGRDLASPDDSPIRYDVAVRGGRGEILCFQINPDADQVADQADNVLTRFHVWEMLVNAQGRVTAAYRRPLYLKDRITPPGGAGLPHRHGLKDGLTMPAGEFSDYLRFAPDVNAIWVPHGRQRTDAHNST